MDPRLHQAFFTAVRSGDADAVRDILDDSGDSSGLTAAQADGGETALYIAAEGNMEDLFRCLLPLYSLETAAVRSRLDLDAFHVAAKHGHNGIIKEFLKKWPEISKICDRSNTSPLYSAAVMDHLDVVNTILDSDQTTARIVRKNGKTALHTASRIGYHRIVKTLIQRDPQVVSVIDRKGQSALHMAVKGRNPDVVEELLMADLSILNLRDKKGNTALHIATRKWRPQMVQLLLSYESIEINTLNNQKETALDLADKIPYGESKTEILESLSSSGAKRSREMGRSESENSELRRTVSDIKHNVQEQLIQNAQTHKRVSGIKKELRKLHRDAVQNTINSVTLVAVLIASIAFVSIFNLPGQYYSTGNGAGQAGQANISNLTGFRVFCLLNATALFISLAVVVVQITLVAWETGAQKLVIRIVNKLMWSACLSTCGAFLSLAYVVVGKQDRWMAVVVTAVGGPIMAATLIILGYLVLKQRFRFGEERERRIKRASGSKSFSLSINSEGFSDIDDFSEGDKKIYAL
ncbi:hypothetical protein LUZ60_000240 [Juncus effusus]|nr:hypothetical protein LUZ60_000240 [Juncus effusus]